MPTHIFWPQQAKFNRWPHSMQYFLWHLMQANPPAPTAIPSSCSVIPVAIKRISFGFFPYFLSMSSCIILTPTALRHFEHCSAGSMSSVFFLLAITFGGDPACTDCNRVLRLPGFLNCKYDPAYPVTVEYPGDSTWNSDDFRLDILAADAIFSCRSITPRNHPDKHTNSEHDWAWVLHELANGKDATKLTRKLASRRADKPNPLYYAQRTVDVASARLWLIEGVPMEDVVTMLVVRRRFEIPTALCSARAREIALTAQRMIARRKVA